MYSGAFSLFHNVSQLLGRCVRIPPYQNNKEHFKINVFKGRGLRTDLVYVGFSTTLGPT